MTRLIYAPAKMAARRMGTLDALTSADELMVNLGAVTARKFDRTKPFGPPALLAVALGISEYYSRKRAAIRAANFRLRYGRDYWTSAPRHPNRQR